MTTALKASQVDWYRDLPPSWTRARIKSVAARVTDGAHISPETDGGVFDFVSTRDLNNGVIDFEGALKTSPHTYAYMVRTGCKPRRGDVLFSKDGTIGATALVSDERDFVVASSLIIITPDQRRMVPPFLNYAFAARPVVEQARTLTRGAGLPRLSVANLARVEIPVPPLQDQGVIADYLDHETAQIDALVAKQDEFIGLLQERRRSLVASTIRGIDADRVALRHFASLVSGSGFPLEAQGQVGHALPFFKVKDLRTADRSGVLDAAEDTVTRETARALRATVIPQGSLVFAKVGAALLLGRVGALPVNGCIDNNMSALVFDSAFSDRFARYVMSTFDFAQFVLPGPVPSLDMDGIREFRVPLIPIACQQRIADWLDDQTSRIDALVTKAEELIALAQERRAALITAAVTGQIDVRTAARKAS